MKYKVKNGFVYVQGESSNVLQLPFQEYVTIGTLPEGCRPATIIIFTPNSMGGSATLYGRIEKNGDLKLYSSAVTAYWSYGFMFPLG